MITLKKIDTKNKVRTWTIEINGNKYRTHYGEDGGKIVTTEYTECQGKNIGKKNETSPEEQCKSEVESIITKQREKGYSEKPEKKSGDVMLAKDYNNYKDKIKFPVYCQPKLDGIRAYVTKDGLFTRNHKSIVSCPHIFESLQFAFKLDKNLRIDGEMYNPIFKEDFNTICSLVKKQKPTKEDLKESKDKIEFWVYDICDTSKKFSERIKWRDIYLDGTEGVKLLETDFVKNQAELDSLYEKYMTAGNEGQMVRLDEPYEEKRSKNLLKRKEFQDDEFIIDDIIEGTGNRTGKAGSILTKTKEGEVFNSNIKLDWAALEDLFKNKKEYIGTICTIKYFNLTPDKKIPRFPYVIKLHGKEKI